jgi:PAS domain S-box-containing protein
MMFTWRADANMQLTFVDEQWLAFTGSRAEREQGLGWGDRIHPEEREGANRQLAEAVAAQAAFDIEFRFCRADGAYRWMRMLGSPDLAQGAYAGFLLDIHEARQRAEQSFIEAIVQNSDDAIISKTPDGIITSWNPGAERMYGYTADEAIGRSIAIIMPPELPDEFADIMERLRRGEHIDHYETTRVRKDGERLHVSVSIAPISNAEGRLIGAATIARNITEQRRAHQRLVSLQQMTAAFSEALTARQVAEVVVNQGFALLNSPSCVVALLEPDGDKLRIIGQRNVEDVFNPARSVPMTDRLPLVDAARTGQPVWIGSQAAYLAGYPNLTNLVRRRGSQAGAFLPLSVHGRRLGVVGIGFAEPQTFDDHTKSFLVSIAQQCAQALERALLYEEAEHNAIIHERERLARDLHDAVTQTLFTASIITEALPRIWKSNPDKVAERLEYLNRLNRGALAEMRTILIELRPERLLSIGLGELLDQLSTAMQARKTIGISFQQEDQRALPENVHIAFYRIAQEALNNIAKHAGASQLSIYLRTDATGAELRIQDNGKGFRADGQYSGFGLTTMRERAGEVGASLQVSSQPGAGTHVHVRWSPQSHRMN